MAEYKCDCRACTNVAWSERFGAYYCLPGIATGTIPLVLHDMGGTASGDYFTCDEFTTEERTPALYETVSVWTAERPCKEWGEAE